MKNKLYILLLCLLSLHIFTACSDDAEIGNNGILFDPNQQELTLNRLGATTSSISFGVEASDAEKPYICLYVDKKIIERIPQYDLVDYLMSDLQKQAEREGTPFADYLQSISFTGNQQLQVSDLTPGSMYEIVAFGISGIKAADKAACLYMKTLLVDHMDYNFTFTVNEQAPDHVIFTFTPQDDKESYFLGSMLKSVYDEMLQSYSQSSIFMALFTETYQEILLSYADEDGYVTEEDIAKAIEEVFYEGEVSLKVSGLEPGTELVWMAAVFKEVKTDEGEQLVVASDIFQGEYSTVPAEAAVQVLEANRFAPKDMDWTRKPYIPIARQIKRNPATNH